MLPGDSGSTKTHAVESDDSSRNIDHGVGHDVLANARVARHHRQITNAYELVNGRRARQNSTIPHLDVAGKQYVVN